MAPAGSPGAGALTDRRWAAGILEAVLFVADEPITTLDLALLLEIPAAELESVLEEMAEDFKNLRRGIVLRQAGGGWRLCTSPHAAPYLERFIGEQRNIKISQAALETLAVIAYRQPVSRTQLAEIRGVNCDRALRALLVQGVIEEAGRDEGPGRAILYGTTRAFLEKAGLNALSDLPPLGEFMPDTASVDQMEAGLGPGV